MMKNKKWDLIIILLSFSTTVYLLSRNIHMDDIYGLYINPLMISGLSIAVEIFGSNLAELNKIPKKIVVPIAIGIPILFAISQYGKYLLKSGAGFRYEKIIHILVALLVILAGNYLPKTKPSRRMELLWCVLLILLPIGLVFSQSSMNGIQSVSIIAALPLGVVIVWIALSLWKDIRAYTREEKI